MYKSHSSFIRDSQKVENLVLSLQQIQDLVTKFLPLLTCRLITIPVWHNSVILKDHRLLGVSHITFSFFMILMEVIIVDIMSVL